MPKGKVEDEITDMEIQFALSVLSGTMTDAQAAIAAGFTAAMAPHVKGRPRVKSFMSEHRAAVQAKIVEHEAETLVKFNIGREELLLKLWELANIDPETTKGSIAGQIKALDSIALLMGFGPESATKNDAEDLRGRVPPRRGWTKNPASIVLPGWTSHASSKAAQGCQLQLCLLQP